MKMSGDLRRLAWGGGGVGVRVGGESRILV